MATTQARRNARWGRLVLAALAGVLPGGLALAWEDAQAYAAYPAGGMPTVEVLAGSGPAGRGYGLRLSLGVEPAEGWRLELGGGGWTEVGPLDQGNGPTVIGPVFEVDRAMVDVTLAWRLWRFEPWIAVGYARVYVEDGASDEQGVGCSWLGCLGSSGAPVTMSGSASGPALAVGVRVALTSHLLLGVTVRQVYVRQVTLAWEDPERLDPPPPPARVGGAWMGLTVAWRFGGG